MITTDVRSLLGKAHPYLTRNLEGAAGFTIARTHYEVTLEHLFLKLLEDGTGDLPRILRHFDVDAGAFQDRLLAALEDLRAGNSGRPVFSPLLLDALERAFLVGAVEYGQEQIRSGTLFASVLANRGSSPLKLLSRPPRRPPRRGAAPRLRRRSSPAPPRTRPATGRFSAPRAAAAAAGGPRRPEARERARPVHPRLHRRGARAARSIPSTAATTRSGR